MTAIIVDEDLCTRGGICSEFCPLVIAADEEKGP
jgi:NAD-dependent dihydropyrimidine dehydrogenase PreA subunit